jgi:hypothetical protein
MMVRGLIVDGGNENDGEEEDENEDEWKHTIRRK